MTIVLSQIEVTNKRGRLTGGMMHVRYFGALCDSIGNSLLNHVYEIKWKDKAESKKIREGYEQEMRSEFQKIPQTEEERKGMLNLFINKYLHMLNPKVPMSQIKFSFHTPELFDQKGQCCYRSRLGILTARGVVSQEVADYLRKNINADNCLVPDRSSQ